MSQAETVVGHMLLQAIRKHYFGPHHRNVYATLLIYVAAFVFAVSAVILSVAGYEWLDSIMPHMQALAATAVTGFFLSLLTGFSGLFLLRARAKKSPAGEQEIVNIFDDLYKIFGTNVEKSIQDNPRAALLAALLTGLMIARRLR